MFLINSIWIPDQANQIKKKKKPHCCLDSLYTYSKNGCSDRSVLKQIALANGKLPIPTCIQYRMI